MEEKQKSRKAGLFQIEVDGLKCKLKPLNRATFKIVLGMIAPGMKDPKYIDAGQIILNTCWVEGDDALKDDKGDENTAVNIAACLKACEMIEIKEGVLKKI